MEVIGHKQYVSQGGDFGARVTVQLAYLYPESVKAIHLNLKPMMPAVALADSPLGTAAWIAEKFWAWSDNDGDLDRVVSKDDLLTDIMLYFLVNDGGIEGSFWFYRAIRDELGWSFFPGFIKTPTAIANFPKDYPMGRPTLETARRGYNVVRYSQMLRGGRAPPLSLKAFRG